MPSGLEICVALPAIVWIGATLPLAVAAKTRIAFEIGFETKMLPLFLLTASAQLNPLPMASPVFEPAMVRIGATLPVAPVTKIMATPSLCTGTPAGVSFPLYPRRH